MVSGFVCRHSIPQVIGPLGNLSTLHKVFEITTTMFMIEVKKKQMSQQVPQNMVWYQLSPEPCCLFFQPECFRESRCTSL